VQAQIVFIDANANGRTIGGNPWYQYALPASDIHFGVFGTLELGEFFGYEQELQEDESVTPTPLRIDATTPITVSGATVTLHFDRPAGWGFASSSLAFLANANEGISFAAQYGFDFKLDGTEDPLVIDPGTGLPTYTISGGDLTFTLTNAATSGHALTYDYCWYGPGAPGGIGQSGVWGNLMMPGPASFFHPGQTLNAFTLGGLTLAMGRLVDDAVVVLESIHRHQRLGMRSSRAALEGANAVALPVLASTLTTMAVLLPVLLLAGLAKKLFAPLALTVGVAMIASYFVSMAVTPVACSHFLGHAEHGRLGKAVEALVDRLAEGYARALRVVLPSRRTILAVALTLVVGSAWAARRLPSTFFPEIDESMDMIYVRFTPGISLTDAATQLNAMGKALSDELPKGSTGKVLKREIPVPDLVKR